MNTLSTHPFFFNPMFGYVKKDRVAFSQLTIGNDVWIGDQVLVLPSVRCIGDGAVIGAGAVVTKDVPSFAVVAGNPARVIRYRFSEATIEQIRKSKWWDKDVGELVGSLALFEQPYEAR